MSAIEPDKEHKLMAFDLYLHPPRMDGSARHTRSRRGLAILVVLLATPGGCDCVHVSDTANGGAASASSSSSVAASGGTGGSGGGLSCPTCTSGSGCPPNHTSWGGSGSSKPATCAHLVAEPELITIGDTGVQASQPNLVALGSGQFAVVYAATPTDEGSFLRFATFDAAGAWPPAPKLVEVHNPQNHGLPVLVSSFRAAPDANQKSFRVFYDYAELYGFQVDVNAEGCAPDDVTEDHQPAAEPLYVSPKLGEYKALLGLSVRDGTDYAFNADGIEDRHPSVTCASTPIAADMAQLGDGWTLAVASGTDVVWGANAPCAMTDGGSVGPATTLTFGRLPHDANSFEVSSKLTTPTPVARVRLAASAAGTWGTWVLDDGSFSAVALDASANPTSLAVTLPSDMQLGSYDAHALGTGFAVASEATGGVGVAVLSASGLLNDSVTLFESGPIAGRVVLSATAALDTAIVAWSETDAGLSVVKIARVRCAD